jgi:hypothetical protein
LGIFVSGGVARKEHSELSSNVDLIDILPPGLYEAVFESNSNDKTKPDLVTGEWIMRCEARTLDDIREAEFGVQANERHRLLRVSHETWQADAILWRPRQSCQGSFVRHQRWPR